MNNTATVLQRVPGYKRPRARRYPFVASIDLTDLENDIRITEQTKDLSLFGCSVDGQRTLAPGTRVRVRISHAGGNFIALGRVAYAGEEGGMGIAFTSVAPAQEVALEKWITELRKLG